MSGIVAGCISLFPIKWSKYHSMHNHDKSIIFIKENKNNIVNEIYFL